jgi:transposase-like protein
LNQVHQEFQPRIKGNIHTDEKIIHVKKKQMYDLNSIDSKTKYVLAHLFVEKRTKKQCRALFKQIKDTCYEQILDKYEKERKKPKKKRRLITFVSDGFKNYEDGAKHYFYRVAKIVFGVPIACKKHKLKHNNNPIEKYNQDIKDHIKTKRHFGSKNGAKEFLDLRHVVKNFVNPHQSLNGKTPAEVAEIILPLRQNKLLELIRFTAKDINHSQR